MPPAEDAGEIQGDAGELLTVPEAAARIGLSERTLYRLLKADNYAAITVTQHRQTATGRRLSTLVPASLVEELRASHGPEEKQSGPQNNTDNSAARDGARTAPDTDNAAANNAANTDRTATATGDGDGRLPVAVYQRRIRDLEEMNAELRSSRDELRADKGRLYEALRLAQENLAREQALRALPAPVSLNGEGPPPGRPGATSGWLGSAIGNVISAAFLGAVLWTAAVSRPGLIRQVVLYGRVGRAFPLLAYGNVASQVLGFGLVAASFALVLIAPRGKQPWRLVWPLNLAATAIVASYDTYALWLVRRLHIPLAPGAYSHLGMNAWELWAAAAFSLVASAAALWPRASAGQEAPPEATGGLETGSEDVAGEQTPPEAPPGPKRGFWARLWGRG